MNRLYLSVALAVFLCSTLALGVGDTSVCTGYPKMYNGKPCASTTRYWDGQKGACGCGSSDTAPFSWQWTKGTAAANAPIFGSGTWCGTGCGKCFKLTPTAVGASPVGAGAPNLTPLVVKVTNLCPYGGNEQWCAYDVNSYGYEAHFDLMDYNMAGLISSTMGWDNPEVTYEEVSCATNGFEDWDCQCKNYGTNFTQTATAAPSTPEPSQAATSAPTSAPTTQAPTEAATPAPTEAATQAPTQKATQPATAEATRAPTEESTPAPTEESTPAPTEESTPAPTEAATTAPTDAATPAPTESGSAAPIEVQIHINGGSNAWWMGFSVVTPAISDIAKIEIMDNNHAIPTWTAMTYEGNSYWHMYSINPSSEMTAPLSLRFTSSCGTVVTANNVITTFQAATIDTGVAL